MTGLTNSAAVIGSRMMGRQGIPCQSTGRHSDEDRSGEGHRLVTGMPFRNRKDPNDKGVYGIGYVTLNEDQMAVVAHLKKHVIPNLIGPIRSASRISGSCYTVN